MSDVPARPLTIVILDGIGYRAGSVGNAVADATTPNLDWLLENCPHTLLRAHGTAVGMPGDDDMGNSEVGHNAIGAGRWFPQGARLVSEAIDSGRIFEGSTWKYIVDGCGSGGGTLHFLGLFSDGNVHSHVNHLRAMLERAARVDRVPRARVHILLDGRDVGETSALEYLLPFEEFLSELNHDAGVDYRIASGGGRMVITMDRYGANWEMVILGWKTHVAAEGRQFASAREAIETLREDDPAVVDQNLPPFVIADDNGPVGPVGDGDSVVLFNFRGDRALQISRAFDEPNFDVFDRVPAPQVHYAGMLQYDADTDMPRHFLVQPPAINNTMGELLCEKGIRQFAISETQKYGHVTYFWNGNRSGKFSDDLEEYVEIPSDSVPFEQRPWMKAAEITDRVVRAIEEGDRDLIRLNLANGDMVGHTGDFQAARLAVESVDMCLGRMMRATANVGGVLLVTADHGNAEEMYELTKTGQIKRSPEGRPKAKTSHTLNPVWFIVYDPAGKRSLRINDALQSPTLTSIAATCFTLLGLEPPDSYDPSLLIMD